MRQTSGEGRWTAKRTAERVWEEVKKESRGSGTRIAEAGFPGRETENGKFQFLKKQSTERSTLSRKKSKRGGIFCR